MKMPVYPSSSSPSDNVLHSCNTALKPERWYWHMPCSVCMRIHVYVYCSMRFHPTCRFEKPSPDKIRIQTVPSPQRTSLKLLLYRFTCLSTVPGLWYFLSVLHLYNFIILRMKDNWNHTVYHLLRLAFFFSFN